MLTGEIAQKSQWFPGGGMGTITLAQACHSVGQPAGITCPLPRPLLPAQGNEASHSLVAAEKMHTDHNRGRMLLIFQITS